MCGSGITAQEKFKKLKDNTTQKYVYYGCTRSKDLNCKNPYLREEELIKQLILLLDNMNLNELTISHKFKEELIRLSKFQANFFNANKKRGTKPKEINLKDYAKYLLQEGSVIEKRELLSSIQSRLVLKDRIISLI